MVVDKVRVQMRSVVGGNLLFEAFLPVHLFWAGDPPPPGPDIRITAIEVTQAIQDLNNSVELVAGKRTYVRVHASAPTTVKSVHAASSGRRGLIYLPGLSSVNRAAGITLRSFPNRPKQYHQRPGPERQHPIYDRAVLRHATTQAPAD
jgi:hypothetical protein